LALCLAVIMLVATSSYVYACASCGCTLIPDWDNLQFSSSSGLKLDLRYDFLNQNELWSGTKKISPEAAALMIGGDQEVEKYTAK